MDTRVRVESACNAFLRWHKDIVGPGDAAMVLRAMADHLTAEGAKHEHPPRQDGQGSLNN